MGITTIRGGAGEIVCISTQTQASVIGLKDLRRVPKALTSILKGRNRVWIVYNNWQSTLRVIIEEERIIEWRNLNEEAKKSTNITNLLKSLKWPNLKVTEDKGIPWTSFTPTNDQVQWIAYHTWAKVTAGWTIGFGSPCQIVSKDTDPRRVWSKLSKTKLWWKAEEETTNKHKNIWRQTANRCKTHKVREHLEQRADTNIANKASRKKRKITRSSMNIKFPISQ